MGNVASIDHSETRLKLQTRQRHFAFGKSLMDSQKSFTMVNKQCAENPDHASAWGNVAIVKN